MCLAIGEAGAGAMGARKAPDGERHSEGVGTCGLARRLGGMHGHVLPATVRTVLCKGRSDELTVAVAVKSCATRDLG